MGLQGHIDEESDEPFQDNVLRMFLAKNRMGPELEAPLKWSGAKGEVRDFTASELDEFNDEQAAMEKRTYKAKSKFGK